MCICFQAVVSGSTKSKGSRNVNPKNITPALRNATNLQRHPLGDISNVDMHSQGVTGTELFIICALRFTTLSCIGLPCFGYVFNLIEHVFSFKQWSQQAANQKDLAMRIQKTSHPHRGMQQICNNTLLVMSLMLTCIPKWVHVCYPVSYVPCESPPYLPCFDQTCVFAFRICTGLLTKPNGTRMETMLRGQTNTHPPPPGHVLDVDPPTQMSGGTAPYLPCKYIV